jgi:DNA-binding NarL/FixJ family response regulator
MSGFELLPVVRQRFPMTRVVAMSSAFSGNEVQAGVAADAFYPKASDVTGLLKIIETMACPDATWSCYPPPRIRATAMTLCGPIKQVAP